MATTPDHSIPDRADGPPAQTWSPAIPVCGAVAYRGAAFKFSLRTEDGVAHRFLLTRASLAWLAMRWWRYLARMTDQRDRSSGNPKADGSPQEGQAV